MSIIQFYAALATTAGIFVGILTAFLVTRLSDYKSQRAEIKRRIRTIDGELEVLESKYNLRKGNLEETEEKWKLENAEEAVDNFVKYTVGDDWNPDPDSINSPDAVDALIRYDHISESELIQHHMDEIERRWDEIIDELQPSRGLYGGFEVSDVKEYKAANWIIETLWKIYEQNRYDSHDSSLLNIQKKTEELKRERDMLVNQHQLHNPEKLQHSIKESIVPILLSVILPLLAIFLNEMEVGIPVPRNAQLVETSIIFFAWLLGFFWTLYFIWRRVSKGNNELPNVPIDIGKIINE